MPFPALKSATHSVDSMVEINDSPAETMKLSIPMVTQLSHSKLGKIAKKAGLTTLAVTSVFTPDR